MSDRFPELDSVRVSVDERTRQRHLSSIDTALRERSAASGGHGRVLAVALALVLLVPTMALAAENAVPGDILYPIKRAVEPVVQLFDSDAPATHRVREVEVLFQRDAPDEVIVQHVDMARNEVGDYQPALTDRIDRVVHDLEIRRTDRVTATSPSQEPGESRPVDEKEVVPVDEDDRSEDDGVVSTTSTTHHESSDTTRQRDRGDDG